MADLLGLLVEAGCTSGLEPYLAAVSLEAPHTHERVTLDCPVTCLELSPHVLNPLRQGHGKAVTVGRVLRLLQRGELDEIRNIGSRRVEAVRTALTAAGFSASRYAGLKS